MQLAGIQIGERYIWGGHQPFGLLPTDRYRHLYLIGQTGTGKSTLMRELITQDMRNGEGCAVIDPHGDLADEVLALVPRNRVRDVVILDPSDTEYPVAFNPFYRVASDDRALVAANLVSTMRHAWAHSWGPSLEYILFNSVLAVLDAPDHLRPTILSVVRLLVDGQYRAAVTEHIEAPGPRRLFTQEFPNWPERTIADALKPVQNKLGAMLQNPFMGNILCQWKPTIRLEEIMAKRQILIVRLPKGRLGEEPAQLMGALFVAGFLQAAMGRPVHERQGFNLYVDEFQNFTTGAFESILSEARKFQLSLCVAHQYIDQLSDPIRKAVFGNVGSIVSFRVGAVDAERLSRELGAFQPEQYRTLDRGRVIARTIKNGNVRPAFQGWTVPAPYEGRGCTEEILNWHRDRYTRPRHIVEDAQARWLRS